MLPVTPNYGKVTLPLALDLSEC